MRRLWFGLLVCGVACSGGKDDHGAAIDDSGGSSNAGGTRSNRSGSSSNAEAGEDSASRAGEDSGPGGAGAGGDGGIIYDAAGAPPDAPPALCKPDLTLGAASTEDLGKADPTLLSMSPDELSLVFTAADVFYVADRPSTKDAFVTASVTLPEGFEAKSGAALSSDGLRLIVVMTDHSGFGQLTRAARSGAFPADADVAPFAKLNGLKLTTGQSLGWPVLSKDGTELFYFSYFGQGLVHHTTLGKDGTYDLGLPIDEFTLGGSDGEYKLIHALSADQRAIFYFDQKSKHAMALFRSRPGSPFYNPVDLGEGRGATPNADCTRVYSSIASGLVVQNTQ